MTDIDRAIDILEHNWTKLVNHDYTENELTEVLEFCLETLKQKQWMITEYEHEVDLLEQDLNDNSGCPTVTDVLVPSAKLGVYNRVLKDLKGDGEE